MSETAPSSFFAAPCLGHADAPNNVSDGHIALALRWPRQGPVPLYLNLRDGSRSLVELGFELATGCLCDVSLVLIPAEGWIAGGTDVNAFPVIEGRARCDPGAWIARTRTGSLARFADFFIDVDCSIRVELDEPGLLVHLDGLAGAPMTELASGRARVAVDAHGAIAYVRLAELTAREAALLEEHRTRAR